MNSPVLPVALALLIGIGTGWFLKPTPGSTDNSAAPVGGPSKSPGSHPPSAPSSKSDRHIDHSPDAGELPWNSPSPGEGADPYADVFGTPTPEEMEHSRQVYAEALKDEKEDQLASLTFELGLTEEQQTELRDRHFFPLAAAELISRGMSEPDQGDPPQHPDLAEVLAQILTEEQVAAYNELRTRHRQQFIESEALSELAEYTHLGLSRDQRDAFYDILYRDLEAEMAEDEAWMAEDDSEAVAGAALGALGGAIIGNNVGDGSSARGAIIGAAIGAVEVAGQERALEQIRLQNIELEIARFQEVLTPQQIERFRANLERQHRGVYSPLEPHLPPLPQNPAD